jgi:hypothetical protein
MGLLTVQAEDADACGETSSPHVVIDVVIFDEGC